mgnify:CR=1 FL=1
MNLKSIVLSGLLIATPVAHGFDLSGTLFEQAGRQVGLDPTLIYAVSLAESARGEGKGAISPYPWTLRSARATYASTRAEAEAELKAYLESGKKKIDVGLMQINVKWNGHRIDSPVKLLDPLTNVTLGSQILAEAIRSAPGDFELGIGRYHSWEDEARARNYGQRILAIYKNLLQLGRGQ